MVKVMIKCPNTGKPVYTGFDMDRQSFYSSFLSGNTIGPCPHCRKAHTWDKKDAYLK